jgi:fluoride exporter
VRTHPRPVHLRAGAILLVGVGGAAGTAARYATALGFEAAGVTEFPVATLAVNLLGAFLLGVLLEALARRGPDEGGRLAVRLLLGTGVMGGFTTYSTFALDALTELASGRVGEASAYVLLTLLGGALAAALGILVAGGRHDRMVQRARLSGMDDGDA